MMSIAVFSLVLISSILDRASADCSACPNDPRLIAYGSSGQCGYKPTSASIVDTSHDGLCEKSIVCANPNNRIAIHYSDRPACVKSNFVSFPLRCASGKWTVNTASGYRPVDEIYCDGIEDPAYTVPPPTTAPTTISATTPAPDPCAACSGSVATPQDGETIGKCLPTSALGSSTTNSSTVTECKMTVTCNNPGKIRAFLTERSECVENDNAMWYQCRNGRWEMSLGNDVWEPVDQIYCPDESATTTTTAAPSSCPGSCSAITTTNTDFSAWNGCCFGYDMSLPALALVEPTITEVSNGSTCMKKFNCPSGYDYVMSIGQNEGSEKACTIFGDLPYFPMEQKFACDEVKGYYVISDAPAVRKYAYACMNIPPEIEQNCGQETTTTVATTTTTAQAACGSECQRTKTTDMTFEEFNGCCFGYDMSKQTLKEPIITDISNETTCAYKYTCPDPANDAFVTIFTNSKSAPADGNRCYIFPTIPMYGEDRIVQCDSSSGKFITPGGSNGDTIFSAIACITYPNTNNNECD